MSATELPAIRRFYASEIQCVANLQSPALVEAFARVPREQFLGAGPWDIASTDPRRPGKMIYRRTPDADPAHLYHNLPVAIDAARELNNGHPSSLAAWLDGLELAAGDRFVHLGAGVGYYTAIAATVVGESGRVTAIEIDEELAERARRNLAAFPQVTVLTGDGSQFQSTGGVDAMFVNAGFTHPLPSWLESLADGGRFLVPITAAMPGTPIGVGWMLRVRREADRFHAHFVSPVAIFGSAAGRDETMNDAIQRAFATGGWLRARSVRVDAHERDDSCCIHTTASCVSAL